MLIIMSAIMTVVFSVTTIAIYKGLDKSILTRWLKHLIQKSFIMSFAFNFIVSIFISVFTGTGAATGLSNLLASLIFGFYVMVESRRTA